MRYKEQILNKLEEINTSIEQMDRNISGSLPLDGKQQLLHLHNMRNRIDGIRDLLDLETND